MVYGSEDYNDITKEFIKLTICDFQDEQKALERRLRFLMGKSNPSNCIDLERIKETPITDFVEVNRAGFFALRDERTPSCKYYADKNRWHDFGTGEGGTVIDLVMKLYDCSFKEAIKKLSTG